jgi:hypothetical protein
VIDSGCPRLPPVGKIPVACTALLIRWGERSPSSTKRSQDLVARLFAEEDLELADNLVDQLPLFGAGVSGLRVTGFDSPVGWNCFTALFTMLAAILRPSAISTERSHANFVENLVKPAVSTKCSTKCATKAPEIGRPAAARRPYQPACNPHRDADCMGVGGEAALTLKGAFRKRKPLD